MQPWRTTWQVAGFGLEGTAFRGTAVQWDRRLACLKWDRRLACLPAARLARVDKSPRPISFAPLASVNFQLAGPNQAGFTFPQKAVGRRRTEGRARHSEPETGGAPTFRRLKAFAGGGADLASSAWSLGSFQAGYKPALRFSLHYPVHREGGRASNFFAARHDPESRANPGFFAPQNPALELFPDFLAQKVRPNDVGSLFRLPKIQPNNVCPGFLLPKIQRGSFSSIFCSPKTSVGAFSRFFGPQNPAQRRWIVFFPPKNRPKARSVRLFAAICTENGPEPETLQPRN